MTNTESSGRPLESLKDLPESWVQRAVDRALAAAPVAIRSPFDLENMAVGVYEWKSYLVVCQGPCPIDASGQHAARAMTQLGVAGYVGINSVKPAIDGLAPITIRHIKAHTVLRSERSNWDNLQTHGAMSGDTRSYGGILINVPQGPANKLRFIVASSGDAPWKDEQLSKMIAAAIVADLIEEGYIPTTWVPQSPTFVIGADPKIVEALSGTSYMQ